MNKQRTAVYSRRNHALFGERLALDIDNAFSVTAEDLVASYKSQEDYEGFKMACIVNLALDINITEEEFLKTDVNRLTDRLYNEAISGYEAHKLEIAKQALPVFKNIKLTQEAILKMWWYQLQMVKKE
jgi:preprotein translocase subunit SecA